MLRRELSSFWRIILSKPHYLHTVFSAIWTHSVRPFWSTTDSTLRVDSTSSFWTQSLFILHVSMSNARTGVSPHGLITGPPRIISIHSPNLALSTTTESVSTWTQLWLIVAFEIALFGLGLSRHHTGLQYLDESAI